METAAHLLDQKYLRQLPGQCWCEALRCQHDTITLPSVVYFATSLLACCPPAAPWPPPSHPVPHCADRTAHKGAANVQRRGDGGAVLPQA